MQGVGDFRKQTGAAYFTYVSRAGCGKIQFRVSSYLNLSYLVDRKKKNMDTQHLPLGKQVAHPSEYDAGQLCPVQRGPAREQLGITGTLPFNGVDVWTAYELSWLNPKGKPIVAVGEFTFPCSSPHIVESKSLKMYCNSLNQTRFDSVETVKNIMTEDLSRVSGEPVQVRLVLPEQFDSLQIVRPTGVCIDGLDIEVKRYKVCSELLKTKKEVVRETLHSHLLRTNCPVTGQPDWATVVINYQGPQIESKNLLAYLVSYRQHSGFHENCVEGIFTDIMHRCSPNQLTVYGRFTRRGGIDINPYRSTGVIAATAHRLARQ